MRKKLLSIVLFGVLVVPCSMENISARQIEEENLQSGEYTGGYIASSLDQDTPVYESKERSGGRIPAAYPDDITVWKEEYPAVRDQNPYGTCWAFSSIGLAEFDLIHDKEATKDIDLSELQLAYFTYNSVLDPLGGTEGDSAKFNNANGTISYLNRGGNYEFASRRLSQWVGAVSESDVPYSGADNTITSGIDEKYAYQYDQAHLENAYLINIKENSLDVKQQILEHGAAGVMYYHNNSSMVWNSDIGYDTYYDTTVSGGGHAVMIVGWDDSFSKDNFTGEEKPSQDGAWLIRNSWGDYQDYFWMSYETASLADSAWIFDFETDDGYDNNYQIDGGIETDVTSATTVANIFTAQEKDGIASEQLKAVSLSMRTTADVSYTIDIYTNLTDARNPLSGTKQETATTSGTTTYAGIYTIPLTQSVEIIPGTQFAVVVSLDKPAMEQEQATSYEDNGTTIWSQTISQGNQKSYYQSSNGKFYEWYYGNYSIKALTSNNAVRTYTISYQMDGGTNNAKNPDSFTTGNEAIALENPEKEGYVFDGWFLDQDFTQKITQIPTDAAQDYVLYAKWTKKTETVSDKWIQSGSRWWYRHADGSYTKNNWEQINGTWYHFDAYGWMDADKWIGDYYVTSSGAMATNTWIGNSYYVGEDGKWDRSKKNEWIQSGNRWWYRHADGSYTKNNWEQINGTWYHFDASGWMEADKWIGDYYVTSSGAMATNTWIGNCYYVGEDGKWDSSKKNEWIQSGNRWWYRHADGSYTKNDWEQINEDWYHFDAFGWMEADKWIGDYYVTSSGVMATNTWIGNDYVNVDGKRGGEQKNKWMQKKNRWWYRHADGSYTKNGWEQIDENWYHFDESGWMDTDKWIGDYYVTSGGAMATNTWIGNYYVDEDGKWDQSKKNEWIQSGNRWWYRHANGSYTVNNWEQIDGIWYYFDTSGWKEINTWIDNTYYVDANGRMAENKWIDYSYVGADGKQVRNQYVDRFWLSEKGIWNGKFIEPYWLMNGHYEKNLNTWIYNYNNVVQVMDFSKIRSISRLGYDTSNKETPPEQSKESYKLAYEKGFNVLLCDLRFTKDGVPVCFHDRQINRIARNKNGEVLNEVILLKDLSYQETLQYDFGIYKGEKYEGTNILTLNEMLELAEQLNVELYIEIKDGTSEEIRKAVELCKIYNLKISWAGSTYEQCLGVINADETARISTMPRNITDAEIEELLTLKREKNEVFFFAFDTAILTDEIIGKLRENNIAFEMGTINSESEAVNYWTENYKYCTGIESDKIIASKIDLDVFFEICGKDERIQ